MSGQWEAVIKSPYDAQPDYAFWGRAVARPAPDDVDPVISFPFRIRRDAKVVTAGSCFAQHISRRLAAEGFGYFVTEPGNPVLSDEMKARYNYGVFSARYGNIYTARQLRQIVERAVGRFEPEEGPWSTETGRYVDPFRPMIQPDGFATLTELRADGSQHLKAVCRAIEQLDVLVFTLGLTECFVSRIDGAVFPVCPGVSGGVFNRERYQFRNFDVEDVVADLRAVFKLLGEFNPGYRAILTVSPVPLIATAENRHVLVSNAWSKAVLRVAAGMIVRENPAVAYFPSYEIVTGAFSRGGYFSDDLRSVTEAGVDHVMRLFFRHACELSMTAAEQAPAPRPSPPGRRSILEKLVQLICEEEAIDR